MKKSVYSLFAFLTFVSLLSLVFAAVEESVEVEFANQGGSCYMTSNASAWLDQTGQVVNWTVDRNGNLSDCFFKEGSEYLANVSCCPLGWDVCSTEIGSETFEGGRCMQDIGLCSNIGSEGSCQTANPEVAERTLGVGEEFVQYVDSFGGICYEFTSARCVWENSSGESSEWACVASLVNITGINDTEVGNCTEIENPNTCVYQFVSQDSHCDDAEQKIIVNYTAFAKNLTGSLVTPELLGMQDWCKNSSKEYACSAAIQLPSFSLFNFLTSIFGIGFIYLFFKKNYKEKV